MTNHLQRIINQTQAKADILKLEAERAENIVRRMRNLAAKDEWTMSEEIEWSEMEKHARMLALKPPR